MSARRGWLHYLYWPSRSSRLLLNYPLACSFADSASPSPSSSPIGHVLFSFFSCSLGSYFRNYSHFILKLSFSLSWGNIKHYLLFLLFFVTISWLKHLWEKFHSVCSPCLSSQQTEAYQRKWIFLFWFDFLKNKIHGKKSDSLSEVKSSVFLKFILSRF